MSLPTFEPPPTEHMILAVIRTILHTIVLIWPVWVVLGIAVVWWFIFRNAIKTPNDGNEFSRDDIGGGGG